jgi:hypothetical protein
MSLLSALGAVAFFVYRRRRQQQQQPPIFFKNSLCSNAGEDEVDDDEEDPFHPARGQVRSGLSRHTRTTTMQSARSTKSIKAPLLNEE